MVLILSPAPTGTPFVSVVCPTRIADTAGQCTPHLRAVRDSQSRQHQLFASLPTMVCAIHTAGGSSVAAFMRCARDVVSSDFDASTKAHAMSLTL